MDFKQEIIKSIQTIIKKELGNYKSDRTYKSVVKNVTSKGYVIIDETGSERTVECCIPGINLKAGQAIWVKVPMGDLKNIHIAGVV